MEKKQLKPVHGILMTGLVAIILFIVSPAVFGKLGLWGTFCGELTILAAAVLVTAFAGAGFKDVFPFRKPHGFTILGTMLLWVSTYGAVMAITTILSYFFPEQIAAAGGGIGEAMLGTSMWLGILIVSIAPAICEEAAFRGVLLHSLAGLKQRWLLIAIVGCVFGAFHGSIWKFLPTAALGMVMTYLVLETNNMLYSILLHMVNNLVPVLLLNAMRGVYDSVGGYAAVSAGIGQIPLASVAVYVLLAAGVPFVLYIGRYFVRRGEIGYEGEIFRKGNRKTLIALIALTAAIALAGMVLLVISFQVDQQFYKAIAL